MMNLRRRLLLFAVGAGLGVWGTYAIDHIDVILVGQRWSVTFLAGLAIGAFPLILGAVLMAGVIVDVGSQMVARLRIAVRKG